DYDDSYCISLARSKRGCVVSNDMYRDYVDLVVKRGGDPKQVTAPPLLHSAHPSTLLGMRTLLPFRFAGNQLV
ncbi:MAG: hypothetical protein SGPRY_011391, partial [Prymnesium sp.]